MTEPTPTERAIEYCHDHEDDEAATAIEYQISTCYGIERHDRPDPYTEEGDAFYATHCADCLKVNAECRCEDNDTPTRRDLCAPGPQGLSHRPLPDLTQPAEQDRALALLVDVQESCPLEPARLIAAIHNRLYTLWTSTPGSPLGVDPSPTDAELGAYVRSLIPQTDRDREPDDYAPTLSAADFLQEVLDACSHD